jgi:hypothetical protein
MGTEVLDVDHEHGSVDRGTPPAHIAVAGVPEFVHHSILFAVIRIRIPTPR